jgi:hypothetical protein
MPVWVTWISALKSQRRNWSNNRIKIFCNVLLTLLVPRIYLYYQSIGKNKNINVDHSAHFNRINLPSLWFLCSHPRSHPEIRIQTHTDTHTDILILKIYNIGSFLFVFEINWMKLHKNLAWKFRSLVLNKAGQGTKKIHREGYRSGKYVKV